ncbi:MAG: hypothetical protein EOO08_07560 [Chitinophagaceae bacterium]|nr:MAG: hypothetical protein EOO08_07560 [Chitinophagaceae bacterium]
MNRSIKRAAGAALAGLLALSACKKKEEATLSYEQQERRTWLTDTTWSFDWAALDLNRDGVVDQYMQPGTLADCVWDNTYTFLPNGGGQVNDSAHRCDTTVPVLAPFSWSLSDNDQYINLTGTSIYGIGSRLRVYYVGPHALTVGRDTLVHDPLVTQPISATLIIGLKNH